MTPSVEVDVAASPDPPCGEVVPSLAGGTPLSRMRETTDIASISPTNPDRATVLEELTG